MNAKPTLPEVPERLKRFPLWKGLFPIHYTVATSGPNRTGDPVFRKVDRNRQVECANKNLCHLCGQRMTAPYWFVVGENGYRHKESTDGPMHEECARYALAACPFLANPDYRPRREPFEGDPLRKVAYEFQFGKDDEGTEPADRDTCIALCAAPAYRSDLRYQFPTFHPTAWVAEFWDLVPHRKGKPAGA